MGHCHSKCGTLHHHNHYNHHSNIMEPNNFLNAKTMHYLNKQEVGTWPTSSPNNHQRRPQNVTPHTAQSYLVPPPKHSTTYFNLTHYIFLNRKHINTTLLSIALLHYCLVILYTFQNTNNTKITFFRRQTLHHKAKAHSFV